MPYRILNLWTVLIGIAALVIVGMMVMFGVDMVRASRTGPRWKRYMITASLAILAAIGVNVAGREASARIPPRPTCYKPMMVRPSGVAFPARVAALKKLGVIEKINSDVLKKLTAQVRKELAPYETSLADRLPPSTLKAHKTQQAIAYARAWVAAADMRLAVGDKPLADVPVWGALVKNWRAAEEAASGRKGRYPFDTETKKTMLADLHAAPGQLDSFVIAGYLTTAEADMLKNALLPLPARVKRMRPTELRNATCYRPMGIAAPDPLVAMVARMPLLEKVVQGNKLHPAAVKRIAEVVNVQIAKLTDEKYLKSLKPESRKTAENVVKAANAVVKKLTAAANSKPAADNKAAGDAK
jgi:hypothetical protein